MKAFDSWKAFFITVGLIVFVVSLNVIMHRLAPVRWDTTSGDVYTLTKGTRSILKKAKDSGRPITIRFYLSNEEDAQLPKELIEYSKRVQDLLAEYAKASSNTVVVQTYSPVPNSEEEDAAELDNILRRDPRADMPQDSSLDEFDFNQRGRASEPYYFGLSISSLQNIETIPFLDPKQESNLEYQLSRAISSVIRKERRKIGLLEGNEMALGGQGGMMGGPSRPPSTIYRYLSRDFDIVPIPFDVQPMKPGDEDHPFADLDLLLIVHPVKVNRPQAAQPGMPPMGSTTLEGLSKQSQYAIDQYLVNGGKAIAFLDNQHFVSRFFDVYSAALPYELNDRHPAWYKDLYNLFQSNGWANYRSGLEDLYEAWGVSLGEKAAGDPIIYDPKYTRPVSYDRPINQLVQREFRLMNQLRQIPNEGVYREIVSTMGRGRALMVNFEDDALNKDHPVTRGLKAVRMVDPSPIIGKPAGNLSMKTLVRSSGKAKAIPGDTANLILNRSRTLDQVTSGMQALSQKPKPYPVAVLLEGNFRSAWEEDPTKEPDPEDNPPTPIPPNPITPPLLPGPVTAP
ncbi:MAG: GldG family protein, partial [Roseibacillus sp.]|nr:GldG family protein [Roseibacillus sp.]